MNKSTVKLTYVNEVTIDLVAELFSRNIAEELRSKTPYVRPIKLSVERHVLGTKAF
jgi:hypothetical protein